MLYEPLPDSNGFSSESDTVGTTGCYIHQWDTPSTTRYYRVLHKSARGFVSFSVLELGVLSFFFLELTPYQVEILGAT